MIRPHHRPVTPKSRRRQLAKSEFLLLLGVTVDRWRREVTDNEPGCLPFAQWPGDDPMRSLAHTYDLTPTDLAKVLSELGTEMETRAMRAGYEDTWAREDAPTPTEGPNASPKLAPTPVDGEDQDR